MESTQTSQLIELIRRIDEVRALSGLPPLVLSQPEGSVGAVLEAADSLVYEVERNRRRVIETTILLAAISEVLSALLMADEPYPALASLCTFLRGAFRLDWVHLGLVAEPATEAALRGPLAHREPGGGAVEGDLELPLAGARNPLAAVLATHRSVHLLGNAAAEALVGPDTRRLRTLSCLPVGPERGALPCRLQAAERQHGTPAGGLAPVRGVLVLGRFREEALDGDHLALLESLAVTVGTVLDNARLTQNLIEALRFRGNVLDSMIDGLLAVDCEGRVLAMNEVAANLLGLERQAALGAPLPGRLLLDRETDADPLASALEPHAATRRAEGWICVPGQQRRPARIATTQLRDAAGGVRGAMATFFDLTHIREMERRLRHLDRIAVLGRFTSSVAHEIRNPLAGIAAGIEYLGRDMPDDDPRRVHLGFVTREVARLERIVADLSRATRPREPQPRAVRVETLISDAIQAVENRRDASRVAVQCISGPGLAPAYVDSDHLVQVLVNLILNAVQAGGEGPVIVRSWSTPHTAKRQRTLWISVEDSGPGLAADKIDRIFEPFFTTKKEGTGLGLYICHEMVERNGGEITARNLPAGGAQFLLELPAGQR